MGGRRRRIGGPIPEVIYKDRDWQREIRGDGCDRAQNKYQTGVAHRWSQRWCQPQSER